MEDNFYYTVLPHHTPYWNDIKQILSTKISNKSEFSIALEKMLSLANDKIEINGKKYHDSIPEDMEKEFFEDIIPFLQNLG